MTESDHNEASRAWFAKGDGDLRSARLLLDAEPPETEAVCFHSQQAAEKYLKGFLARHGEEPPRTHNLTVLIDLESNYDEDLEELYEAGEALNPFAVHVRYPSLPDSPPDESDAASALAHAETIREHVFALL